MSYEVVDLKCQGCGARVTTEQTECMYCHGPVTIRSFNSVSNMSIPEINKYASEYRRALEENPDNTILNNSIAMCYLKLNLYDKAISAFEKAIEDNFDNSQTYFYAAISLLKGQKPYYHMRETIDKAMEYLNAAVQIEPLGIYYFFMAYIKKDYFERKFLNVPPSSMELLMMAKQAGTSPYDITQLFAILKTENPFF